MGTLFVPKTIGMHVNPQMGTNSVWEQGVLKWEFLSLPAYFYMGTPRMETGTVVLDVSVRGSPYGSGD